MNNVLHTEEGCLPGIFISFEGGEGAGKSTHIRFLAKTLEAQGQEVVCLREPGGTPVGERLREIVLDTEYADMSLGAELFLYEAARAQLVSSVIKPALRAGKVVLCDRFYDSTIAYQVYGRGLDFKFVQEMNDFACQEVRPLRTILLTHGDSARQGLERATRKEAADRLEQEGEDFHTRVNEGFLKIAQNEPERIKIVASSSLKSYTAQAIFKQLSDLFPWMQEEPYTQDSFFKSLDDSSKR